jgi:hypothetical protein
VTAFDPLQSFTIDIDINIKEKQTLDIFGIKKNRLKKEKEVLKKLISKVAVVTDNTSKVKDERQRME